MSSEPGISAMRGFLDAIGFCLVLVGGVEAFYAGKPWQVYLPYVAAGFLFFVFGEKWERLKATISQVRSKGTEIDFIPGLHPFVQLNGLDQLLYRVAVKSKGNHSGVFLVISKIDPQPPGVAVTEIYLTQMHDRPQLNADGRLKKTFDLNQEQPIYIDVVLKTQSDASICVMHGMPDHIDQRIPAGNYTITLETRGPVVAQRKFIITVDGDGVLGFGPLLSKTKLRHKWGLGLSIIVVVALICYGVIRHVLEGTHAVTTSNPSPQAATAIDPRIKGIPPAAKEVPSQDIAHGREAVELCKRARALAGRIRDFQWAFEQKMSSTTQTDFQAVHEAKTDSDQQALWAKQATARKWAYDTHDKNFRETYVSEAKYLRDRLIDKLPPETADALLKNNAQSDMNLTSNEMAGSGNENKIAIYLDELALAVCPTPPLADKQNLSSEEAVKVIQTFIDKYHTKHPDLRMALKRVVKWRTQKSWIPHNHVE